MDKKTFHCTYTTKVPEILENLACSIAITVPSLDRVVLISEYNSGQLIQLPRQFHRPRKISVVREVLAVAGENEIQILHNAADIASNYPGKPDTYDSFFIPRATFFTGPIKITDLNWDADRLFFSSSKLGSINTINNSFENQVISSIHKEGLETTDNDYELTGFAMVQKKVTYCTIRQNKGSDYLLDLSTNKIIIDGLDAPCCPRLYDDELFLLESGTGKMVLADSEINKKEDLYICQGIPTDMAKWEDYVFVTVSKPDKIWREKNNPLNINAHCSIDIIHLPTGLLAGQINFNPELPEISSISILHNNRRPGILPADTKIHHKVISSSSGNQFVL